MAWVKLDTRIITVAPGKVGPTYSEVSIVAPDSAAIGSKVDVTIKIKNVQAFPIYAYAIGVLDSEERFIDWLGYLIPAGVTHSFSGSFTMWNRDVTIHAYSYIEDEYGVAHSDNEAAKDVKLGVVPGWVKLDTQIITITPEEAAVAWVKLDTRTITLIPVEAEPIPPEYKLVYSHGYPLGKTYVGKASEGTSKFTINLPEQFIFPRGWIMEKIASEFEKGVEEQGQRMLDLKIYEDATPIFQTHYIIKSTCTDSSPFPWAIVIIGILAILLVVAITNLVTVTEDIDWSKVVPAVFPIAAIVGIAAVAGLGIALTRKKKVTK